MGRNSITRTGANQTTPSTALDVLHHQHNTSSAVEGVVWFTRLNRSMRIGVVGVEINAKKLHNVWMV